MDGVEHICEILDDVGERQDHTIRLVEFFANRSSHDAR